MDPTIEEALRAKENAEKLFTLKDFTGAKQFALRAQSLCPHLQGIAHMVATFEIYAATETKINREIDFYSVFGLDPSADKSVLKKRYKKMAVLLHPDKNKTVGADEAFKLVSEAWAVLSDNSKRHAYDAKRNKHLMASVVSSVNTLDTFWTVCTSCRVQYEYLRKYVNKRLSCKNCRGVFVAVETGTAPITYTPWAYTTTTTTSDNGYGTVSNHSNHSYNGPTYVPSTSVCFGNGSTHGYEYNNGNVAFQWNTGTYSDPSKAVGKSKEKQQTRVNETVGSRLGRPPKKRKIETSDGPRNGIGEAGIGIRDSDCGDVVMRQFSFAPAFDARKMLIEKARNVIRGKLKEMKVEKTSGLKVEKNGKTLNRSSSIPVPVPVQIPITVPDPDFHDFDMDRSEEVFKPKQIWAIYDEEDGMPRLYCIIRQVISVKPFQVHITYLNSKPEPESVKPATSGITKSCGSFRVAHSDIVDQVNIFSHLLGREKTGRNQCVTIYPKRGDVWAVYRNWSRKAAAKSRRQYEMVEVVDDYSEKVGVCVTPLVKLEGYKTVYQRGPTKSLIPKKEMTKFSHQVPACLLKGRGLNLPDGCWDLDPAATPEQLLQAVMEVEEGGKKGEGCFGNL